MGYLPVLSLLAGLGVLTLGAEGLVRGATALARRLGLSPLVIGLTVVAFGTSMPEAMVSVDAAVQGRGSVALGNAVGSNIFNVLVVLGAAALVRPLAIQRQLVRVDVPVLIASALLLGALFLDADLSRGDGLLLLGLGVLHTVLLVWAGKRRAVRNGAPTEEDGAAAARGGSGPGWLDVGFLSAGLLGLVLGARLLVWGATEIALALEISELVVGLTIVAAGTSLPELATSLMAAFRGQREIAVGNVVGSNIFNTLMVLGAAGVAAPGGVPVPRGLLTFDLPVMIGVSLACLPIFFTGWAVSRREGALFLAYYGAYVAYLIAHISGHEADDVIRSAILFCAVPLTVLSIGLIALRQAGRDPTQDSG